MDIMDVDELKASIEDAWAAKEAGASEDELYALCMDKVEYVLELLAAGTLRVAEEIDGEWVTHTWIKQAVLLSFKIFENGLIRGGPNGTHWYDKVSMMTDGWDREQFKKARIRKVPGSFARFSAYVEPDVILMPSFLNVAARVGAGTMVDTWATVGSCAQVGKNCHISGGAGIGGVLEPLQDNPTIIEDGVFIGARSEIVEGVIVREGAVIGMGVFIGASTRIFDREKGEFIAKGEIPANSVVVSGSYDIGYDKGETTGISVYCAVIVKTVDAQTRAKTSPNKLLREAA